MYQYHKKKNNRDCSALTPCEQTSCAAYLPGAADGRPTRGGETLVGSVSVWIAQAVHGRDPPWRSRPGWHRGRCRRGRGAGGGSRSRRGRSCRGIWSRINPQEKVLGGKISELLLQGPENRTVVGGQNVEADVIEGGSVSKGELVNGEHGRVTHGDVRVEPGAAEGALDN